METHLDKTIPRITARHLKKIRSGLNVLMNRIASLFRMINDSKEKDEKFIQKPTYDSFLLSKRIQEKIGKKLSEGNVYRNIPKEKKALKDEIEGKDVEKDLNEAKYRADSLENILTRLRVNIAYLQEIRKREVYDKIEGDHREEIRERKCNARQRTGKQLTSAILAQIYNLSKYLEPELCPRNDTEVYEMIHSNTLEETLDKLAEEIRSEGRQINIEISSKLNFIRQVIYSTDAKKTIQLLTKDQTPQCDV
jgi:hypothetical protein